MSFLLRWQLIFHLKSKVKEFVTFYNKNKHDLSFIHLLLEKLPGWSVDDDDIDPVLWTRKLPAITQDNTNLYALCCSYIAPRMEILFLFDTIHRKIKAIAKENLNDKKYESTVFISYRNLAQSIDIDVDEDSIFTRFNVRGDDDLNVINCNYGDYYVMNLDYFLCSPYISDELLIKVKKWIKYRDDNRDKYIEIAKNVADASQKVNDIIYRNPADDLDIKQWDDMNEDGLNESLKYYNSLLTSLQVSVDPNWDASNNDFSTYKPWTKADGSVDHDKYLEKLKAQENGYGGYYTYYDILHYIIPNIEIAIRNLKKIDEKKEDYIKDWETNWDLYGTSELDALNKKYTEELEKVQDYAKPWSELTDEEKRANSGNEDSYNIYHNKYVEIYGYISANGTLTAAIAKRNQEKEKAQKILDGYNSQMSSMKISASINNADYGFTDEDKTVIYSLFHDQDYQNNNIVSTYVNINIGLYGIKTNGASCWFIPFGGRSNSSGTVQKVSTVVQLDSDVRSFSVCIQCAGSGTFSGTLKIRNVSVYRMMGNELIVDGAITAAKIRSGEVTSDKIAANAITADKITTNNIAGTNGWINLRSGTFKYNDGALAWDGSTMTIGGFKISKYKIINDAIGICSTTGQEWAFWAGASSGANAPFHVGHNGSLYAENATIGGIIRAKQSISVYNATFATYQDVVKWDGSNLSIGLVGNAGSTGVKGAQIAFSGSQISVGNSSIVCGSISGTNSSFTNVWVENFTSASTFKENITCNKNLKVKGDFTFADYQQDTLATASEVVYRRPIASAASNNSRVAFLQGASGNKISIRAQYGKSNFSSATFTGSSSDIRLKRDIKDSSVNALSKIMQMKIREFNWKQTGIHQELGCVADELELIDPLLTTGGGYDDDGTMNIKSIDTLLLSEYAIKGIQELYRQNKQQQKRIEYLESQLRNK